MIMGLPLRILHVDNPLESNLPSSEGTSLSDPYIPFLTFVYTNEADETVLLVLMEYGLLIGLACSVYILNYAPDYSSS